MAKINIPFDNQNYSIDESALATATSQLQSHLSTVMNGTGATINLGGNSYNIDSTKLSTATNAFISHLGTIAGSGTKVVVNGVEYAVDSAKMNSAIADLHTVLGGLHSEGGESGGSNAELNPSGAIPNGAYYANLSIGTFYDTMPATISEGDVYIYGDYVYSYNASDDGWTVNLATADTGITSYIPDYPVTDLNQTSYDAILESINGKKVKRLYRTFADCSSLHTAPAIPDGVTIIDELAFQNTAITSVTIPDSVTFIGAAAFGSTSLTSIEYEGTTVQWNALIANSSARWNGDCGAITVTCTDGTVTVPAYVQVT